LNPDLWKRTEALYYAARARAPEERAGFLDEACRGDESLRREVESLLNEPESDDGFLATPVFVLPEHVSGVTTAPETLTGRTLGGYRLQSLLGAGGMGEVYRAQDMRLGREVAIKVLPHAFTSDGDRLARFEREARMLAALNHTNICAIYGLDEADGIRLLVLELVEGETLAARLARTSSRQGQGHGLPLRDALDIARQMADALEVAHDKGIVHRDLKPANVKITPDGIVKVLDFGLAKAVSGDSAPGLTHAPSTTSGEQQRGAVIGTAAYMSPEQARGRAVDKRTDIWAFGCVLYEMLTGRLAFPGDTVSDSIAKILEREPEWSALPATTPVPIRRLLLRCLAKDPRQRSRDIRDVRIEIDAIDEAEPASIAPMLQPRISGARRWLPLMAVGTLAAMVGLWEVSRPAPFANPLPSEGFQLVTDWPGSETFAEISPDAKVVAFLADRDGEIDLFSSQLGSGDFKNLTEDAVSLNPVAIYRWIGFSGDSTRLWFGIPRSQNFELPWSGGTSRRFLVSGAHAPAWSSDDRLVYFNQFSSDSLWIADGMGRNAKQMAIEWEPADQAPHTHNMVWSPDNQWIYFVHGVVGDWNRLTDVMDIWRIRPSGGKPERLTYLNTAVTFLAILDENTLLFIAPEENGFGSWLWSLDVRRPGVVTRWFGSERATPRRIPTGTEQYTSVSASRDGSRVVATRANPTAGLWRVPILGDRQADENDVRRVEVQTERALAPRYAARAVSPLLFYLSARGTGDRLWGFETTSFEITKGAEGHLTETPAPAPDGGRVAVVVKEAGKRHVAVMNRDGQGSQSLAPAIEVLGGVDWSPDGASVVASGRDTDGIGLFVIPVDGGEPRRIFRGAAVDPAWSPDGDFIVYSGVFSGGSAASRAPGSPLKAVRPDGKAHDLPLVVGLTGAKEDLRVSPGGYRFLDRTHVIYRPNPESLDFWLFDLVTGERRQITRLGNKGSLRGFDITPDRKQIVFDRVRQNSDIVRIDLPKK
jgi:serine/threonine protein kinase